MILYYECVSNFILKILTLSPIQCSGCIYAGENEVEKEEESIQFILYIQHIIYAVYIDTCMYV